MELVDELLPIIDSWIRDKIRQAVSRIEDNLDLYDKYEQLSGIESILMETFGLEDGGLDDSEIQPMAAAPTFSVPQPAAAPASVSTAVPASVHAAVSAATDDQKCTGTTTKGLPCKHNRKPGSLFCSTHQPKTATSTSTATATETSSISLTSYGAPSNLNLMAAENIREFMYMNQLLLHNRLNNDLYEMPREGLSGLIETGNKINLERLHKVGSIMGSSVNLLNSSQAGLGMPSQAGLGTTEGYFSSLADKIGLGMPEISKPILSIVPVLGSGLPQRLNSLEPPMLQPVPPAAMVSLAPPSLPERRT